MASNRGSENPGMTPEDVITQLQARVDALRDMLEELTDAAEFLSLYPEGAFGIEDLREAQHKARKLLEELRAPW